MFVQGLVHTLCHDCSYCNMASKLRKSSKESMAICIGDMGKGREEVVGMAAPVGTATKGPSGTGRTGEVAEVVLVSVIDDPGCAGRSVLPSTVDPCSCVAGGGMAWTGPVPSVDPVPDACAGGGGRGLACEGSVTG